jgi:hypothetical protein
VLPQPNSASLLLVLARRLRYYHMVHSRIWLSCFSFFSLTLLCLALWEYPVDAETGRQGGHNIVLTMSIELVCIVYFIAEVFLTWLVESYVDVDRPASPDDALRSSAALGASYAVHANLKHLHARYPHQIDDPDAAGLSFALQPLRRSRWRAQPMMGAAPAGPLPEAFTVAHAPPGRGLGQQQAHEVLVFDAQGQPLSPAQQDPSQPSPAPSPTVLPPPALHAQHSIDQSRTHALGQHSRSRSASVARDTALAQPLGPVLAPADARRQRLPDCSVVRRIPAHRGQTVRLVAALLCLADVLIFAVRFHDPPCRSRATSAGRASSS